MAHSLPRPPFIAWPQQIIDESLGFAWYARPAVFINQVRGTRATVAHANFIQDNIDHVIAERRNDIEAAGGLLIIHD